MTATDDGYETRPMTAAEVATTLDWAAAEGWNPGLADAGCFQTVDRSGFWGGFLDGRMVAAISVVNYDRRFAFLGCYIAAPAHRGRGYGYRLWQSALEHAGSRVVGLDGVPAEQDNYRRSGFDLAYRNIRYGGVPDVAGLAIAADLEVLPVVTVTGDILDYDRRVFPAARAKFLDAWLSAPEHTGLVALRDGQLAGFGVARPCRNGRKIGPLFADDGATAEALVGALLDASVDRAGSGEVFLDVPEPVTPAVALAEALGLVPVFETARMYRGPAPSVDLDRVFGVTTFELG